MSHHYSGPDFGFPHGDARLDFTDLYAFPKPGDGRKSILIMNVHPSAGVNPPGPTTDVAFLPQAIYELRLDTNGDTVAEFAYRGGSASRGGQTPLAGGGGSRFFAGWRGDPFFFDVNGALNNLQFTGDDYFADKDVCSIVLEVPNSALGSGKLGLWARTLAGDSGKWVQ